MRILVDSTVWIDFFRRRQTAQASYLKNALLTGEDISICGHIFAEVLRGVRSDEQYQKVLSHFEILTFLPTSKSVFRDAADIYRLLKRKGLKLKNSVDTFIAAVALSNDIPLLHNDQDFNLIALEFPLKLIR